MYLIYLKFLCFMFELIKQRMYWVINKSCILTMHELTKKGNQHLHYVLSNDKCSLHIYLLNRVYLPIIQKSLPISRTKLCLPHTLSSLSNHSINVKKKLILALKHVTYNNLYPRNLASLYYSMKLSAKAYQKQSMIFCFINVIKDHQIVHVFYTLTIKSCKLETSHQIIKFMLIVI